MYEWMAVIFFFISVFGFLSLRRINSTHQHMSKKATYYSALSMQTFAAWAFIASLYATLQVDLPHALIMAAIPILVLITLITGFPLVAGTYGDWQREIQRNKLNNQIKTAEADASSASDSGN